MVGGEKLFVRSRKKDETGALVYVDRGPWYPWALERFGFQWVHRTFSERSPIEGDGSAY